MTIRQFIGKKNVNQDVLDAKQLISKQLLLVPVLLVNT